MAEDFNTDSMLDMFLYESEQLLENLQNTVLEKKDEDCFDETSINEILLLGLLYLMVLSYRFVKKISIHIFHKYESRFIRFFE